MNTTASVRVLHVLACDALAGTELMVASLILRSDASVVRHELATLQRPGPIAGLLEPGGHRVLSLGGRGGLASSTWRLARLLRSRRYDVVAAYGLKASVAARVVARLVSRGSAFVCGVRALHVTEVERLDSPKARLASWLEWVFSPLVDIYDSNSRAALDLLAGLGIDGDRFAYIPNGLDLRQWKPREGLSDGGGPPLILCAARFVPRKRQQDLLEALGALRRDGHSFRAVLAGAGPLLPEMRLLASSLGLDGVVEMPGPLGTGEMRRLLETASIACLASASEGMPGALMEAMAMGVPVVGTDVSGTDELIVDGRSGLLVPAYDPPALALALARVLEDPELGRTLAEGGRRRMEESFSLDVMLSAKERLFVETAGRAARGPLRSRLPR